jgi:hypothetical protein
MKLQGQSKLLCGMLSDVNDCEVKLSLLHKDVSKQNISHDLLCRTAFKSSTSPHDGQTLKHSLYY